MCFFIIGIIYTKYLNYRYNNLYVGIQEGNFIGIIQLLRFNENDNSCEVSYMLGEEYWNKGYTTEALKSVFEFGFKKIKLDNIIADHYSENIASGKVMLKAGMKYTGRIPDRFENEKGYKELDCYKITKEEWEQINLELQLSDY